MYHSGFIFISVIAFALCENAVTTDSRNGTLLVVPEQLKPTLVRNGTVETKTTPKDEIKLFEKVGESIRKESDVTETKVTPTKTTLVSTLKDLKDRTSPNPSPTKKISEISNKNEIEALTKSKLKLKLSKLKEDVKEKAEAVKNKWENFAKNLDKIDEAIMNRSKTFAKNSRELKDNKKRMQILEWFYNGRPLFANETRLWASLKSDSKIKADKDLKDKTDSQTEKDRNKSHKDHKIDVEFHTVETESKEKEKQKEKQREKTAKLPPKEETTTTKPVRTTNDSKDSDSNTRALNPGLAKSKKAMEAKMSGKIESENDMTSEESLENVTNRAVDKQKAKVRTIQRFAPMKDGPSSSESSSVS